MLPAPPPLLDELVALDALYGSDAISSATLDSTTSVSIVLPFSPRATLSVRVDHATYPSSPPPAPTLRVPGMTARACTAVVRDALERAEPVAGEVCLFEYCEAVLTALSEAQEANKLLDQDAHEGNLSDAEGADGNDNDVNVVDMLHGEPLTDRRSVFQAHVAPFSSRADLAGVLNAVRATRKGASATHHTWALRLAAPGDVDGREVEECDDDGEHGAGRVVLDVLRHTGVLGVVVVVSRWFGGVKLGPVRFRHIGRVAREAIDAYKTHVEAQSS